MSSLNQSLLNENLLQDRPVNNNSIKNKNSNYSSIYCLKAIGAFFVICIHCYNTWIIYPIIRTAVPFFFMISGFFLYKEDEEEAMHKCIRALKKVFWIMLYANLFYYLCFLVPNNFFPIKTIKNLIYFVLTGEYIYGHLWYLNAYLQVLVVMVIAMKLRILKYVWYFIPIGIIFGLLTGSYEFHCDQLPRSILLSRNFFTMGIPCVGIGWLLKKYYRQISKIVSYSIFISVILLVLSIVEVVTLHFAVSGPKGDFVITTFPLAASIMLVCLKYPLLGCKTLLENTGIKYATYIYIFHMFVLKTLLMANGDMLKLPDYTIPFIVYVVTIIFIQIWEKSSKKMFKA